MSRWSLFKRPFGHRSALGTVLVVTLLCSSCSSSSEQIFTSSAAYREEGLVVVECVSQGITDPSQGVKLRDGTRIKLPPGDYKDLFSPRVIRVRYYPGDRVAQSVELCPNFKNHASCLYSQSYTNERTITSLSSQELAGVWNLYRLWENTNIKISVRNVETTGFDFAIYDYQSGGMVKLTGSALTQSDTVAIYNGDGYSITFTLKDGRLHLSSESETLGDLGSSLKICTEYTSALRTIAPASELGKALTAERERQIITLMLGDYQAKLFSNFFMRTAYSATEDGGVRYTNATRSYAVTLKDGRLISLEKGDTLILPEEVLSAGDWADYFENAVLYLEENIFAKPLDGRMHPDINGFYRERIWQWTDGMEKNYKIKYIAYDLSGDGSDEFILCFESEHPDGIGYTAVLCSDGKEIALPQRILDQSSILSALTEQSYGFYNLEVKTQGRVIRLRYNGENAYEIYSST